MANDAIVGKGQSGSADGRSMKVTGVRHDSLRCRSRSDEALKLVEEHTQSFQGKQEKLQEKEDWKAISTGGECSDRRSCCPTCA